MIQTPQNALLEQTRLESDRLHGLNLEVAKVIIGQEDIITFIVIALLCDGHILLEGVPGVAKTTMIKSITNALGLSFKRIQFTPDLLPADLIGTLIFNAKTHEFETKKGPIFANLILADEINRAPAKVQSALLEAMQEQQVTIGSQTYPLDKPFLVFATQNPVEQEGTYRLPEAQLDRFMLKLTVTYPSKENEKELLKRTIDTSVIQQVLSKTDLHSIKELVKQIYVDDRVLDYIVNIVFATREPQKYNLKDIVEYIQYGVSPRATIALLHAAKAYAFIRKRHFVTPDDVKSVAPAVLRHRITRSYQAEADEVTADAIVSMVLKAIPSP